MRQLVRVLLLGVFVVLLFGAINGHHVHPATAAPAAHEMTAHEMTGHQMAGHHAAMLAAPQGHPAEPETSAATAGTGHDDGGHMLLRLCLAALAGAIGLVVWLFVRGAGSGHRTQAPVFSRPPPRPAARSRPPTGRVLAQLCVLRT